MIGRYRSKRAGVLILAGAAVSLLVVRPAPGYDAWMWLLWGREVVGGGLSTADGPAFKPLPVAVCALLAPLGGAAPWAWVAIVRVAAVAAIWLAFRLGRDLARGWGAPSGAGAPIAGGALTPIAGGALAPIAGGALAAVGVALCGGFAFAAATGAEAPLVIAFGLAGVEAWRRGRLPLALACGAACALLRVEAWPFLAVACALAWRRGERGWVAGLAIAVPAAWFVPEWLGSGDPLRSGARARVPMPGQPALADVPALASLDAAARVALWPLLAGLLFLRGRRGALVVAGAGVAWVAVVAAMAQAGFSGEPRYALPGVALICVAGGVGLANVNGALRGARGAGWSHFAGYRAVNRLHLLSVALLVMVLVLAAAPRISDVAALRGAQAHQAALADDLRAAVAAAGGREAVLACGTPYVGPLRGPLMAYTLRVTKRTVEPDAPPHPPGVVFTARLTRASAPAPAAGPGFAAVATAGAWQVRAACPQS